jgi:hypothetical protein
VKGLVPAGVTAVVRGPVEVDREVVDLDERNRSAEVVFHSPLGRAFRCMGAATNHPSVTATVGPPGNRVQLTFDPSVKGWEYGIVTVSVITDQPDDREVRIAVRLPVNH